MTDLLDPPTLLDEPVEPEGGAFDADETEGDLCKYVDDDGTTCTNTLPAGHHPTRLYCEGHQRGGYLRKAASKAKDKAPGGVTVNVKVPAGPKVDAAQRKYAEAATAWLGMAAGILDATGDATCAEAVRGATPEIARNLAILCKYHPVIAKVLIPVEGSGEGLVWLSLVVAASPVILTVLAHHNLISEEWATRLGVVSAMGAVVGAATQVPSAEAETA